MPVHGPYDEHNIYEGGPAGKDAQEVGAGADLGPMSAFGETSCKSDEDEAAWRDRILHTVVKFTMVVRSEEWMEVDTKTIRELWEAHIGTVSGGNVGERGRRLKMIASKILEVREELGLK